MNAKQQAAETAQVLEQSDVLENTVVEGTVIHAIGGFFTVLDDTGQQWQTKARGKVRRQTEELLVGDRVRCHADESRLVIDTVFPRKTLLQRPPVANVDQLIVVMACTQPSPNWMLLDRLLIMAEVQGIQPLIFLNKADLVDAQALAEMVAVYARSGYRIITGSTVDDSSAPAFRCLRQSLAGHISVFAGPSGVGKSSILNRLDSSWTLATGDITRRTSRGRHTTRSARMLLFDGMGRDAGMVVDTPGFYSLETETIPRRELAQYYPEMRPALGQCRFGSSCMHVAEPDCAVKELLAANAIPIQRYQSYVHILEEMKARENQY